MSLHYRPDWEQVRERHVAWWKRELTDRPLVYINYPREGAQDDLESPTPANPKDRYLNVEYRIKCFEGVLRKTGFHADAVPSFSTTIAPGDLALFAGAHPKFSQDTVWFNPVMDDITKAEVPRYDPDKEYWKTVLDLMSKGMKHFKSKSLVSFPDLIEGLDILAALRGTKELLLDMCYHRDHVHRFQRALLELYFEYYDRCYEITRDGTGGSCFWIWAPGRIAKLQCDFSAMISPVMFEEFVVPYLSKQCQCLDHSFYHLDGPGAIRHLDLLLDIPDLDGIQWTPGAGNATVDSPQWFPMYRKIQKRGKLLLLFDANKKHIRRLVQDLSPEGLLIRTSCLYREEADELFGKVL